MATINLAPGSQFVAIVRRRRRQLYLLTAVVAVVIVVAWAGLTFARSRADRELATTTEELRALEVKIAELEPAARRIRLFEERLQALAALLDNHVSWQILFEQLEALLPAPAVVQQLEFNLEQGSVNLIGRTPHIDAVVQSVANLTSAEGHPTLFTDVALENITRREPTGEGGDQAVQYEFAVTLTFNPSALRGERLSASP